ncbi:MAG: DNA recombination protein RmuC [Spirochaetes bacterium]|nr:MAG: DNA recombination protein RmuC [Spirochaetota bacterium]
MNLFLVTIFGAAVLLFLIIIIILQILILSKKGEDGDTGLLKQNVERLESRMPDEFSKNREENRNLQRENRKEILSSLDMFRSSMINETAKVSSLTKKQLDSFEQKIGVLTGTIEQKLELIRNDNSSKLEEMRKTVDEKLHETLEKRLGDSFKLVSERLEEVHKGLGEMQSLATGVGDLKKVLTNIKTRGTWGEVQLGAILESILTPDQYSVNVATKKSSAARVEFAIKLPGKDDEAVWLPIDAKFPKEDYEKLVDAQDAGDMEAIETAKKNILIRIKQEAKDISTKYLDPPGTTDFGILFLPVEGLYAEVLRMPGIIDTLQRDYRIVISGPTTLSAFLNSLQMGFRTLVIEKRSSEVWSVLGAVKTEFSKFGDILDKTKKKLQEATNTIDTASRKSRTIHRKLRDVAELPDSGTPDITGELFPGSED